MTLQLSYRGTMGQTGVAAMLEALASQPVPVREKYISAPTHHGERYSATVDDYIAHQAWMKARRLVCPEFYTAEFSFLAQSWVPNEINESASRTSIHLGYSGSVTPLHFDWDFASVFHVCLKGRRRMWLAPPAQERRFPATANSALVDFEVMGAQRRETVLRSIGCSPHDLEPGEFIRFPSFWWHLVEYVEASLAISARTEINPILRPLTMLPRSPELQRLIAVLATAPEADQIAVISKLVTEFQRSFSEGSAAVNQCCDQLGLARMEADPWIVPRSSVNSPSPERRTPNADEIRLCRDWLFGRWPRPLLISDEDANTLASQMASSISRPQ